MASDAGFLGYCELSDALGPGTMMGDAVADARIGRIGCHALPGLMRQSAFGRFPGYEDVNDAKRLCHDPAMRWIVDVKAALSTVASGGQMGPL